uniref:Uncharacterized protein n=1 Tax=viral metagenome TaxID=1070528 RepID=A0A6M3MB96_9ZZZZ
MTKKEKSEQTSLTKDPVLVALSAKYGTPVASLVEMAECLTTDLAAEILVRVGGAGDEGDPLPVRLLGVLERISKDRGGRVHRLNTCRNVCGDDGLASAMHFTIKRMRRERGEQPYT